MQTVKIDAQEKAYFDTVADGEGEPLEVNEVIDGRWEITWHVFRDGRREQVIPFGQRLYVRSDGICVPI